MQRNMSPADEQRGTLIRVCAPYTHLVVLLRNMCGLNAKPKKSFPSPLLFSVLLLPKDRLDLSDLGVARSLEEIIVAVRR